MPGKESALHATRGPRHHSGVGQAGRERERGVICGALYEVPEPRSLGKVLQLDCDGELLLELQELRVPAALEGSARRGGVRRFKTPYGAGSGARGPWGGPSRQMGDCW